MFSQEWKKQSPSPENVSCNATHIGGWGFFTFYVSNISALLVALESAVQDARDNRVVPADEAHERIRTMYTWQNVARRTELVSDTLHAF